MIILLANNLCLTVIWRQPVSLLAPLQRWSAASTELVISSTTYAELVTVALLPSEQEREDYLVEEFCARLDVLVAWDSKLWMPAPHDNDIVCERSAC